VDSKHHDGELLQVATVRMIWTGVPWELCSCQWRRYQALWIQSVLHEVCSETRLPTAVHNVQIETHTRIYRTRVQCVLVVS